MTSSAGNPEALARQEIDRLLAQAGWHVCDYKSVDLHAATGVAIREFPLVEGHGDAGYLLYVNGTAAGIIEAKKHGAALTDVERQSARYSQGLPAALPAWARPLPFAYESTGVETHFTNGLDPEPRARSVFAFHLPETLAGWLELLGNRVRDAENPDGRPLTFLQRLQHMPPLVTEWRDCKLWPAQITAIRNLEANLAQNKPRALIQMATGSGKTFTAISFIYRLIKFAGARRVLFLVDRGNLGRQTKREFDQYVSLMRTYINSRYPGRCALEHMWFGVSIEYRGALGRLVHLRQARAAVRFISFEPLLEDLGEVDLSGIHWAIAGGESGRQAREIEADWVRSLRDQCRSANVAVFFKQWGGRTPRAGGNKLDGRRWQQLPFTPSIPTL
ncbi:MAG: DUF5131 family protein [Steroidobacteraceae bacterium]